MRVLAFDTATAVGSIAVAVDGEVRAERSAFVRASHGETLLPHVEQTLRQAGLGLHEVDLFAVGIGPGSFTGVRIGVATAKGLALAERKPVVGLSSLRVVAAAMPTGAGVRVPVFDAYKGEVYCAAFELSADAELDEVEPPFHAPPQQAVERLRSRLYADTLWMAGSGLSRYGAEFRALLGPRMRCAPAFCGAPRAACLAHEAVQELTRRGPSDAARLEPMYLRPSDAKLPA